MKIIEVLTHDLTWMNDTQIKLLTAGNVVIKPKREKKIIPRDTHLGVGILLLVVNIMGINGTTSKKDQFSIRKYAFVC